MRTAQIVAAVATLACLQCSRSVFAKEKYWFDAAFDSLCYYMVSVTEGLQTEAGWQGCIENMGANVKRQARNRGSLPDC